MAELQKLSIQDLQARIADLFVTGSLYKKLAYNGDDAHYINGDAYGRPRYGLLPRALTTYCGTCKLETVWETRENTVYFGKQSQFHHARYVCRNCGGSTADYWFLWIEDGDHNALFMKVGQYPALSIEPLPELAKALGPDDTELYKRALICGNFSFGIGALVYFRRVIENQVNVLIDLIAEAAHLAEFEAEELAGIAEIKKSHRVDERIAYASKILPPHLRPGGHNPLDKLYSIASIGIHGKSDEECLDDFNKARFEFEYLFKNLTVSNEDAKEFVKRVSSQPKNRAVLPKTKEAAKAKHRIE